MAGGPTPPPEQDLAHSWFTVNWEVSVEWQVCCQKGGFKIVKCVGFLSPFFFFFGMIR